jgi:mono/diheme cytochrome c family protein
MKIVSHLGHLGIAIASLALFACSEGGDSSGTSPAAKPTPAAKAPATPATPEPEAAPETQSPEQLAARGRVVYMANCIACHNMDPNVDGALGPAISGSSHELLEERVLRAAYPAGYTPKRDSTTMIALPYLAADIDALTAYLNP